MDCENSESENLLESQFTALDLAKRHSMLSGHFDLTMDDEEPIHLIEENDQASLVLAWAWEILKSPFVDEYSEWKLTSK